MRRFVPAFRPGLALSLAFRGLIRDPSSTALAVTILALGIALPATFFSFLVGATRDLPVPGGDRIVRVDVVQPSNGGRALPVTGDDLDVLQGSSALQALGGFRTFPGTMVDRSRAASRVSAAALTPEVLPLLRVSPELGRIPSAQEAEGTLLIGHGLWQDLYDGDPAVLGRSVELNGTSRTIVGVLPEGFGFPFKQNAWVVTAPGHSDPSGAQEAGATRESSSLELVGRLADGAGHEAATAELAQRWSRRNGERPADQAGAVLTVRPYTGGRGEGGELVAFTGLVLVGLCLLLIACANVANLLLVRATERVRALGIQVAVGASRVQIGAQLLLESLLVAAGGGALGLLAADWTVSAAQRNLAAEHWGYFWMRMAVDGQVLAFTVLLVLGTAVVAGLLPIVRVSRVDVQRVLKEEGAGATVGGGGRWSRAFVTTQLALSCGAVVAAALTGRALAGARHFGDTLPSAQVLVATIDLPVDLGLEERDARLGDLRESLASAAGVRRVSLALGAPGYGELFSRVELQGTEPDARATTGWNAVDSGYLGLFDIPLRAGRALTPADDAGSPRVALVSESFVKRFFPDLPVLGRTVRIADVDSAAWFTIVGVVGDVRLGGGARERDERVLVPLAQVDAPRAMSILRTDGDAALLAPGLRAAVAQVDPTLPIWDVRTLADAHAYLTRVPRALASMALAGGSAGLLVAAVGLYGLLAFRVRQRRRELGVRLALGADGLRLVGDVLRSALHQLLPAVGVGLVLAWALAPFLQAMLLGQDPRGLATYVGVGLVFLAVGMAAALVPALRAGRVDPARVLRGE